MFRAAIAVISLMALTACSSFPIAGRGGMAEFEPLKLAFWDTQDQALAPADGLKFEITLLKHQLDLLVLEGAKICFPASVVQAKLTEQRMMREYNGGLLLDAATQVEIQQHALLMLEKRLDKVLQSGACRVQELAQGAQGTESVTTWLGALNVNNQFALDSAKLTPAYQDQLTKLAPKLAQIERQIVITGHTDVRGSESYNLHLAKQRAEAVAAYLIDLGVNPDSVQVRYLAAQQPYRAGNSPEHYHSNRRVTLSFSAP